MLFTRTLATLDFLLASFGQEAPAPAAAPAADVESVVKHLSARWVVLLLAAGVVLAAYFVNRYAPKRKKRIRRVVMVFAFYLLSLVGLVAARVFGVQVWVERLSVTTDLLEAFA